MVDEVCSTLHVPLAVQKHEGPTTCLTFLSIEINLGVNFIATGRKTGVPVVRTLALEGLEGVYVQGAGIFGGPALSCLQGSPPRLVFLM